MNQEENKGLGLSTITANGELASSATAARAKALVEAKFVMAMHRPRNIMQARTRILEACQRPAFADGAIYAKPVGGKTMEGLSIRFAETAIQCMMNIDVSCTTIYEDADKRILNISLTDLETNTSYGDDITISKTVERKFLKEGQTAISERLNSKGEKTYLVSATEDDLANKVAAAKSKIIRNSGLRLIPQDILQEATDAIWQTREKGGTDPKEETKKIVDAFAKLNVPPAELQSYLGHSLETIAPKELRELRSIYATIRDGESSWNDYVMERAKNPVSTPKKPKFDGPEEVTQKKKEEAKKPSPVVDVEESAAGLAPAIETPEPARSLPDFDKPYDTLKEWSSQESITAPQIIAWSKANKNSHDVLLCSEKSKSKEIMDLREDTVKFILTNWDRVFPSIKAVTV